MLRDSIDDIDCRLKLCISINTTFNKSNDSLMSLNVRLNESLQSVGAAKLLKAPFHFGRQDG